LAYHAEPRATDDIDINILLPPERGPEVVVTLGGVFEIEDRDEQVHMIATHDQTRLGWGPTYVDLFFVDTEFHESMATRVRSVDFGGTAEDLVVCKALFNRPHDWVDILRIVEIQGQRLDTSYSEHWLRFFVGDSDPVLDHLREVQSR